MFLESNGLRWLYPSVDNNIRYTAFLLYRKKYQPELSQPFAIEDGLAGFTSRPKLLACYDCDSPRSHIKFGQMSHMFAYIYFMTWPILHQSITLGLVV